MTELDQLIATAYASQGKQEDVNKVHLALLRHVLYVPVRKKVSPSVEDQEPFSPLFTKINDNYFMAAFDTLERLTLWAGDKFNLIDYVEITGLDVIKGINEKVFLCLNAGSDFYKEFSPEEIRRLKIIANFAGD